MRTQGTKTVVVLGAAYAGRRCVQVLSQLLPAGWRLVVIDRNSHFNHVYVFPRYTVLPTHAPKAFVPYDHAFEPGPGEVIAPLPSVPSTPPPEEETRMISSPPSKSRVWIHGVVTRLEGNRVRFRRVPPIGDSALDEGCPEETVNFDYCVYALGASLPAPVDVWHKEPTLSDADTPPRGHKLGGILFMQQRAESMRKANSVIVVGGGALGIQLASDLKEVYPVKRITLIHSRARLLPIYPLEMHDGVLRRLKALGVDVILEERVVNWPPNPDILDGQVKVVQTTSGRRLEADLILPCTGQQPRTSLLSALAPNSIVPSTGRIRVRSTLQIHSEDDSSGGLGHMFAAGDCAETGSIQAGHTAYWQGQCAAYNVVRLINAVEGRGSEALEVYKPGPPAIKVTLGLQHSITSQAAGTTEADNGQEDLNAIVIWESHGVADLPITA